MSQEYTRAVGQRLRAVRVQQGLSLKGVEKKSNGRWKAVVVGSYERGDSAITVVNLDGLAGFYGVPAVELLPDAHVCRPDPRLTLDLTALARLPSRQAGPLSRYAAALQSEHGDHDGQIFTVRVEDLRSLAVVYGMSPATRPWLPPPITNEAPRAGTHRRDPGVDTEREPEPVVSRSLPVVPDPDRRDGRGRGSLVRSARARNRPGVDQFLAEPEEHRAKNPRSA